MQLVARVRCCPSECGRPRGPVALRVGASLEGTVWVDVSKPPRAWGLCKERSPAQQLGYLITARDGVTRVLLRVASLAQPHLLP